MLAPHYIFSLLTVIFSETRSMSQSLAGVDPRLYPASRIFNAHVVIEFDARIQRQMFELRPARRIRRRVSLGPTPQNQQSRPPTPMCRQLRRHSIAATPSSQVSRVYVCPAELRSAIENIRTQIGRFDK